MSIEVGEFYEDADPRSGERVIQVIYADEEADVYRYLVRTFVWKPWLAVPHDVGWPERKGRRISGRTLRHRYQKISR
jgi:hypothetical protein